MASPAQILANRANAQKSTGPRSAEGKAASRFNALKHGLDAQSIVLPGEDPAEYEALARDYDQSLRPETPTERFHVDTMIRSDWQKRRLQLVEAELFRTVLSENPGASLAAALLSQSPAAKLLTRIQRQLAAFEKAWFRAHRDFHSGRKKAANDEDAILDALINAPMPAIPPYRPKLASFPENRESIPPAAQPELASAQEAAHAPNGAKL